MYAQEQAILAVSNADEQFGKTTRIADTVFRQECASPMNAGHAVDLGRCKFFWQLP